MLEHKPNQCPVCDEWVDTLGYRRMNTAYVREEDNWLWSCERCWEESEEYWAERWIEYWRERL